MKCLFLAAGYATRLYPLTQNFPKPLLEVQGKSILDWLIADLEGAGVIDKYVVVSNHKFADNFTQWAAARPWPITVVDDGTSSNETRLGAVRDIEFAVQQCGLDDDLLVIAGDNLLDFRLTSFLDYIQAKGTSCVMRYFEPDTSRLRKSGVLQIDAADRILAMTEKPQEPASNWCCPPFYFYRRDDLKLLPQALTDGCGVDAPGSLVAWLCQHVPIHAMEMPGHRYDIGSLESYQKIQETYQPPF